MFDFIFALVAAICYGTWNTVSKKNIQDYGLYNAISYAYIGATILLLAGALLAKQSFYFPGSLIIPFLSEAAIGTIAILALFKAFEQGEPSILGPLSYLYILIVMIISVFFLGETPTILQVIGSLILVLSAVAIAFKDLKHLEKGVVYLLITILGWGYYYSFLKSFVPVLGAYMANFYLEGAITVLVLLYAILTKKNLAVPKTGGTGFVFLGISLLVLGSFLVTYSAGTIGSSLTSALLASGAIFTEISSYLLLKEKLQLVKYVSIILMVFGLALVFLG